MALYKYMPFSDINEGKYVKAIYTFILHKG